MKRLTKEQEKELKLISAEIEAENMHLIFVRDSLKEEIFRLENQPKPKPRKKRNLRANKIKVGK